MSDEKEQADLSNDTPEETPSDSAAVEAVESAQESVDELRSRIADLESRRTKEGRSAAETKRAKEKLEADLAEKERVLSEKEETLDKWNRWYVENHGTPAQKAALQERQSRGKDSGNAAETDTWRAIAEEENPQVKKVLLRAAKSGDFLTKKQIAALRASFEDDEEEEEKKPPKVKPVNTGGASEKTLEQKLADAKKAGNASEILRISSQIAAKNTSKGN